MFTHNHGLVPGRGGDPLLLPHLLMLAGLLLAPLWLWYSSYIFHLNSHSVAALCKQVAVRGLLLKDALLKKEKTSISQAPIKLFFKNFSSSKSATSRWLRSESTLLPVQTGLRHFSLWVWSLGLDNGAKTFLNIVNVVVSSLSKYLLNPYFLFVARQGRPDKTYKERIWSRNQPGLWYVDI